MVASLHWDCHITGSCGAVHSPGDHPLDSVATAAVVAYRSCKKHVLYTHKIERKPSVDCPIVIMAVGHREETSPHLYFHALDWRGEDFGSNFLGLDAYACAWMINRLEENPPLVEVVLPRVVHLLL